MSLTSETGRTVRPRRRNELEVPRGDPRLACHVRGRPLDPGQRVWRSVQSPALVPSAAARGSWWARGASPSRRMAPLYVADFTDRRVDVFSATGEFKFAFGKGVNASNGAGEDPGPLHRSEWLQGWRHHRSGAMVGPKAWQFPAASLTSATSAKIASTSLHALPANFSFLWQGQCRSQRGQSHRLHRGEWVQSSVKGAILCRDVRTAREPGLGIGPGGDIYVADLHNNRIQVFTGPATQICLRQRGERQQRRR